MPARREDIDAIDQVIKDFDVQGIGAQPLNAVVVRVVRELVKVTVRTRICSGPGELLPEDPRVREAIAALPNELSISELKSLRARMLEE